VEKEESDNLERFFTSKKLYFKLGIILVGVIFVFYAFNKMKADVN
jgi:hypothetical protein